MLKVDRWKELMGYFGIDENLDTFSRLQKAYSEKHRYYHNTQHINATLSHLDLVADQITNIKAVELALWFHDAVYNPFSSSNEVDSADWASDFLKKNSISTDLSNEVYELILATLHDKALQDAVSGVKDEHFIVDIDLSILGSKAEVYQTFERLVRKEYRWVPSFIYKKKRRQVLESFMQRKSIYYSQYFQDLYEKTARLNISNALADL